MVCAPSKSLAAITGGFVRIPAGTLAAAWDACRERPLGVGDFRAWLAAHEMAARRGRAEGRTPAYGPAELAGLCHVTERRARASVRRLVAAGLLEWSGSAIGFPAPPCPAPAGWADSIGRGEGDLAVPRRLLRFLAGGAAPAIIAVALGALLRCVSRRKSGWDGRGRLKASWVAGTFGVSHRQVKAARKALVDLGWLAPEPSPQWTENRWGRAFRVDLAWKAPRPAGARPAPPCPVAGAPAARPVSDPESFQEEIKDQEPAGRGPARTGVELKIGKPQREPDTLSPSTNSMIAPSPSPSSGRSLPSPYAIPFSSSAGAAFSGIPPRSATSVRASVPPAPPLGVPFRPASQPKPPPRLEDVRPDDLREVDRTLALFDQAAARGLADPSEAGRIRFLALAEHAAGFGARSPGGLFAALLRRGAWSFVTQADEDAARRRLREHRHGRPVAPPPPPRPAEPAEVPPAPRRSSSFVPERPAGGPTALGELMARLGTARGLG